MNHRVYDHPHQCDRWVDMQSDLRRQHPHLNPKPVIAALQCYSDKTVVNFKNASCHPVRCVLCVCVWGGGGVPARASVPLHVYLPPLTCRCTLLNIPLKARISCLLDVAYFPNLQAAKPGNMSTEHYRLLKLLIYKKHGVFAGIGCRSWWPGANAGPFRQPTGGLAGLAGIQAGARPSLTYVLPSMYGRMCSSAC